MEVRVTESNANDPVGRVRPHKSRLKRMYCTSESCGSIGVGAQCINNICLNGTCHAARLDTAVKEHANTVHAC
jgi:hypothetical protein